MRNEELTLSSFQLFPIAKIRKPYEYAMNSTEQSEKVQTHYMITEDEIDCSKTTKTGLC